MARSLYALASWALMALGALHMAATRRYFDALTPQALWFFSGGVLMVVGAALNLLNRAYGHMARGVYLVCIGTNFVLTGFAITSGIVSRATVAQWIIVLGILGSLTVLSLSRRVFAEPPPGGETYEVES